MDVVFWQNIPSMILSPVVKKLVKQGLLEKFRFKEDERIVMIKLTDAGKKMKKEIGVPITLFPIKNITWGSWYPLTLVLQNDNPLYNKDNELIINNKSISYRN